MTDRSTRRMSPIVALDRWLYRKDGNDYGPLSTDELLKAIEGRAVDLQTQVCSLKTGRWGPAAEHAMLRDYYDKCAVKWERDAFHTEADAHAKKLARRRANHGRLWVLIVVSLFVAVGFGAWIVWRLTQAEPLGLDTLTRVARAGALPPTETATAVPPAIPMPTPTKVAPLPEPETYDTAGVAYEGDPASGGAVRRMDFGEDGRVRAIGQGALNKIVGVAKKGLYECAKTQARRDRAFKGTNVGFTVEPGKITGITVGKEVRNKPAFRACVKATLRRVGVPTFEGGGRRVTVPIKIAW